MTNTNAISEADMIIGLPIVEVSTVKDSRFFKILKGKHRHQPKEKAPQFVFPQESDHKKYLAEFSANSDYGNVSKHPSQYRTTSIGNLIKAIAQDYKKPTHLIDYDKLIAHIEDERLFQCLPNDPDSFWTYPVYRVNKKKLRNAIKRLYNKCLVNHKQKRKELEEQASRDFKWSLDVQDFVRETSTPESDLTEE